MKGWYGNRQAHSLASKGIKTTKDLYGVSLKSKIEKIDQKYIDVLDDWFGNMNKILNRGDKIYEIAHVKSSWDGTKHDFVIYSEAFDNTFYVIKMFDFQGKIQMSVDGDFQIEE